MKKVRMDCMSVFYAPFYLRWMLRRPPLDAMPKSMKS